MKDLATGIEVDISAMENIASPITYQTIGVEPEFGEIDIDEVNFQLQLASDEARGIVVAPDADIENVMPPGRYYVGDLCYVIDDDEVWSEVCDFMFAGKGNNEGQFTLKDGRTFVIYGTRYGDGTYESNLGTSHSVDAGVIGAMLESQCDQKYEHIAELGAFIDFHEPWTHSGSGGDRRGWDGVIRLGHIEIQT
jgi:hypothetical protein